MKSFFDWENPFLSFLSTIADLMIINMLTLVCSLPIITIGPALTSMYYVLLRIRKDESNSVVKDFFHAFKMNFMQATVLWVIYLLAVIVLTIDYYLIFVVELQILVSVKYVIYLITALVLISLTWSFILLSRYNDSLGKILYNSYCIGFTNIIRTVAMDLLMLVPFALLLTYPASTPVVILIGIVAAGYLQTFLFSKVFERLEKTPE